MPSKKGAPKASSSTLEKVIGDFNSAWQYAQSSWHKRWEDNYRLYNNQRVKYGYEGITDTFVPMAFSTVETLTSGLFGSKPKFNFTPPHTKKEQKTDILNALLDFYWEKDQWSLKTINTGRNMFKLGTAVDYFVWEGDHPCLINVPIRDFFIDPTASSLDTARFMGRRYLTTLDELESYEIVDLEAKPDENGDYPMKKKYKNLDKVKPDTGSKGDNTDKQEKDMWYGSTVSDAKNNQVEVIEYWTNDQTVSIANRSVVIEDTVNYFKAKDEANGNEYPEGLLPFADARDYIDESLFYAKGEIDIIADQQELLNDQTNQRNDAIIYSLNQMYTLDPKYAHMIDQIENLPGAVYPVEASTLQPIQKGVIPPDSFNESLNLKNEIRETTASNEVVRGVGSQNNDTTATEINAQIAGAGQRFSLKVTQLENGYFYRVAKIVLRMVRLFVTEPMMVRIIGKDGARWEEFNPSEFDGDYEPHIQLEARIENERLDEAANAKELYLAFRDDPDINQQELKKMTLAKAFNLDPDEVEMLTNVQPPLPALDPAMDMGALPPVDPMQDAMPMLPPEMPIDPMAVLPPELAGAPV